MTLGIGQEGSQGWILDDEGYLDDAILGHGGSIGVTPRVWERIEEDGPNDASRWCDVQ
jgi:hypothetical protein